MPPYVRGDVVFDIAWSYASPYGTSMPRTGAVHRITTPGARGAAEACNLLSRPSRARAKPRANALACRAGMMDQVRGNRAAIGACCAVPASAPSRQRGR
jgi:hypothetical protein